MDFNPRKRKAEEDGRFMPNLRQKRENPLAYLRKTFKNKHGVLRACKWTNDVAQADYEKFKKRIQQELELEQVWEKYAKDDTRPSIANGERNLKKLVEMLKLADRRGFRRSPQQVQFHKAFIAASLQRIMGDDLTKNLVRLMQEYDLTEIRNDVIICTPRRWGKTTAVALYAAAYILTQPNCEISIYSTGRRASKKLLALIWTIVVALVGKSAKVFYNQEMLAVKGPGSKPGVVYAYPSKEEIDPTVCI